MFPDAFLRPQGVESSNFRTGPANYFSNQFVLVDSFKGSIFSIPGLLGSRGVIILKLGRFLLSNSLSSAPLYSLPST